MTWLSIAMPFPVTYNTQQVGMQYPILGVVLHTTNHTAGSGSLGRFQNDWQNGQWQSAHFAVDRTGAIGQYRSLTDVAWHIGKWSASYIGIEHIAHPQQDLSQAQIESSARIIAWCSDNVGITISALDSAGNSGIGVHRQFSSTQCGRGPLATGSGEQTRQFFDILEAASKYKEYGLY